MGVVYTEWLNKNELRAYPLQTASARTGLPNNLIVDANIWLPQSAGQAVYLSSVRISKSLVTLTLLAAKTNPFAVESSSSSGEEDEFVPLAVLNVPKPVVRFKNYALQAIYPGAGGWLALGQAAIDLNDLTLRYLEAEDSCFVDRCVRVYQDIPVGSLGKVNQNFALMGLVKLTGESGVTVTRMENRIIDGVAKNVAVVALDLTSGIVSTLLKYVGTCGHRPQASNCNAAPITMINDVTPDTNGNIDIQFENNVIVGDVVEGMLLDSQQSLAELCPPINPNGIFINPGPGGYIPPPIPPEPSSSHGPEPSSSAGPTTPDYCEEFTDPATVELYPREGNFSIITVGSQKRYSSSPATGRPSSGASRSGWSPRSRRGTTRS